MVIEAPPARNEERDDFYQRLNGQNLEALWNVFNRLITPEPKSVVQPFIWEYAPLRERLMEAGELITAKEAERRVLILENPALRGQAKITNTLYAGLQLVLPNEIAPSHRHSQSALRFVVEGGGAYTSVDGERTYMNVGDFVVTAPWRWHEHGNETGEPMIWLDGLDIPIVQFFESSFTEGWEEDEYPNTRSVGYSDARFGRSLLPVDCEPQYRHTPIVKYPYERSREALEVMRKNDAWSPVHGLKLRYSNPVTGGHAMGTIGTSIQLIPKDMGMQRYRSTDATVVSVVEGEGETTVAGQTLRWKPKDIFVIPSWQWVTHQASSDTVFFSYSDRPLQEVAGLFREQTGNNDC